MGRYLYRMRISVFSDIHGNIYAFEAMVKALRAEGADAHVFCGDVCGYYYYQNEIIDILRSMDNLICVQGNHDHMFLQMLKDETLEKKYIHRYGQSSRLFKQNARKESLAFLKMMPTQYVIEDYGVAVFHGSPWDKINEYIYPSDSLERFEGLPYNLVLLGHTHYPMDRCIGGIRVVNPGSCGQPRDFRDISYAIIDLDSTVADFRRIRYNSDAMIRDVISCEKENRYLREVLTR